MYTFLLLLVLLICFLLVIFVLVQNPKGGGLGAGFSTSSTSSLGSVQQTSDFLERGTWALISALFVILILSGVFMPTNNPNSLPTQGDDTKTKIEGIIEGDGE